MDGGKTGLILKGLIMSEKKFDKNKLPSRHVSVGPERAPHRSYYYAMGMTEDDIETVSYTHLTLPTKRIV